MLPVVSMAKARILHPINAAVRFRFPAMPLELRILNDRSRGVLRRRSRVGEVGAIGIVLVRARVVIPKSDQAVVALAGWQLAIVLARTPKPVAGRQTHKGNV